MVISSMRASNQLAKALEARAFGSLGVRRTYLRDIRFRPIDCLSATLSPVVFIGLRHLNLRHGFGSDPVKLL